MLPDEVNDADSELNHFAYRLIANRRYSEASTMLHFGLVDMKKHGQEAIRKMMVVNFANAEKLRGDKAKSEEILAKEDWSACTDNYKICIAAIRDDVQTVTRLMKDVVDAKLMHIADFRDWPVFENIRSDPVFIETFEREFEQKIMPDREADPTEVEMEVEKDQASSAGGATTLH